MRIKRNDVSATIYTKTTVEATDGYESTTTWVAGTTISLDAQPLGAPDRARLAEFGPDVSNPLSRIGYCDKGALAQNAYLKIGSQAYQVRGLSPWYSHDEVFLAPYQGTI